MAKSKDLFDDSTMSFGEHLEVLRIHLWRAIIGLLICVIGALFFGNHIIDLVRGPIDEALQRHGMTEQANNDLNVDDLFSKIRSYFDGTASETEPEPEPEEIDPEEIPFSVSINRHQLWSALAGAEQSSIPEPDDRSGMVQLELLIPELARLREDVTKNAQLRPVTLNVQEAFLTYLKVSFVTGFVIASPWVFYQLWLFVAAGLYPHERRYVHYYLPVCLGLFATGAVFCFVLVFPFVLDFLLGFNKMLGVVPQIRLSEWISFSIMLPVMFGLSFQLPLVMLLLERLQIVEVETYRTQRRMSILVISIVSCLMTPADPMSMLMMMIPLVGLYELGIVMCRLSPVRKPFETEVV